MSRSLPLVALGFGMESLYLVAVLGPFSLLAHGGHLDDLGDLTGHQISAGLLITAGLILLFGLYLGALRRLTREGGPGLALVLAGTFAFSLTLSFLYPVTAMDVYNYAVQGHVVTFHGINPLVTAPATVQGDAFISYSGVWAESTSPYGPLWIAVSVLDSLIAGMNVIRAVLVLKAISALGVVATTILLAALAARRRVPHPALAALFGWNPLVQLELVGNGHNDALMIALFVLAGSLLAGRRGVTGALALAGSVFVKYITVVALPFYFLAVLRGDDASSPRGWRERLPAVLASVGVFAVTAALAYAPFWAGPMTLARIGQVDNNYLGSFAALVVLYLPNLDPWLLAARVAVVALVALWQVRSFLRGRASLASAVFEVYFAVLLVATHFAGWYVPLLLALGIMSDDRRLVRRAAAFSFAALLTTPLWEYAWPALQNSVGLGPFHLIVVPLTFFPPLLMAGWDLVRSSATEAGLGEGVGEGDRPLEETVSGRMGRRAWPSRSPGDGDPAAAPGVALAMEIRPLAGVPDAG